MKLADYDAESLRKMYSQTRKCAWILCILSIPSYYLYKFRLYFEVFSQRFDKNGVDVSTNSFINEYLFSHVKYS